MQEEVTGPVRPRGPDTDDAFPRFAGLKAEVATWEQELAEIAVERVVTAPNELKATLQKLRSGLNGLLKFASPAESSEFYAGLGLR